MWSITAAITSVLLRLVLPLVILSVALAHAASPERLKWAEELNKQYVCPQCGYCAQAGVFPKAQPSSSPGAVTTNGYASTRGVPKDGSKVAPAGENDNVKPVAATKPKKPAGEAAAKPGKAKPKLPPAVQALEEDEDSQDEHEDDEFPDHEEHDDVDEGDEDEETVDEATVGKIDYSKMGEGDDPDNYAIGGEMSVNLDDPKIQEELREAARKDPTFRKELLAENMEDEEKIKEILGDIADEDDDDDDDDVDLDIEAEVPEADGDSKKIVITKVNKLLADQTARMTLRKKIQMAAANAKMTSRTTSKSMARNLTTMTAAGGAGRFSMIMAVSQGYLNSQLAFRHAITPTMHRISAKLDSGAEIDASLNTPQISLHFDDGTASSALYHMSFGAGTCKLWDGTKLVECETKDWKYAFMVNLSLDKLDSSSSEAGEIAKSWGKPGDYSISRLLIDLKSADLVTDQPEYTRFGTLKQTKKTLTSFKCLVLAWMQQAESSGGMVMGHSLTTDKPETVVDSNHSDVTIPTSQILQTYPYIPAGETEADEGLGGKADSNMLIFLNMTKGRPFPTSGALAYSGNWCTPKIPGTLCIARQVLFDDFLLPLLREVNKATHLEPTRCKAKFARLKSKVEFDIGKGKHPDSWFDFKPTENPNKNPNWSGWEWKTNKLTKEDKDGRKNIYCRGKIVTFVQNTVKPIPGTNRIEVSCYADVSLESKVASIGGRKGNATIKRTGKFEIRVKSVADGNVELSIDGLQPGSSPLQFEIKTSKSKQGLTFLTPQFFSRIEKDMRDEVTDSSNLKKMATQIQESIGAVGTFVVPGGGHFFMEGAIFNNARDLLFETEYKGAN